MEDGVREMRRRGAGMGKLLTRVVRLGGACQGEEGRTRR